MAEQVERVVVVVDVEWEGPWPGHLEYSRYAVTTQGTRVDDRRWRAGSSSGTFFDNRDLDAHARAAELREETRQTISEQHKRKDDRSLQSLVSALHDAGVATTPDELRAVPVAVEFTDAAEEKIRAQAAEAPPRLDLSSFRPALAQAARRISAIVALALLARAVIRLFKR
jgi:hypothetical protein